MTIAARPKKNLARKRHTVCAKLTLRQLIIVESHYLVNIKVRSQTLEMTKETTEIADILHKARKVKNENH